MSTAHPLLLTVAAGCIAVGAAQIWKNRRSDYGMPGAAIWSGVGLLWLLTAWGIK